MKTCNKCGAEIATEYVYCPWCGWKCGKEYKPKTKRANGDGTVYKISNRNWKAVWVVGWKDATHPIRRTKSGFASAQEAKNFLAQKGAEKEKVCTMADYWQIYSTHGLLQLSDSRQRQLTATWQKIPRSITSAEPQNLSLEVLQSYADNLAPSSAKRFRDLFSALYKLALADGRATTNVPHFIVLQKSEQKEKAVFSSTEIDRLWEIWNEEQNRMVGYALLMCYTGMMPLELCDLRTEHIDWDRQTINGIGKKTQKRKSSPILLPSVILPVLRVLSDRAKDGRLCPMRRDTLGAEFKQMIGKYGFNADLTPYSCRHTCATMFAPLLDPNTLTEQMRHGTLKMTEHYKHNQAEIMVSKIDKVLDTKKEQRG